MNERIQDLMKQSMVEYQFDMRFSPEKFAELIVAECVDIVEHSRIQGDEGVCLVGATKNKIKKHFGVTE